MYHISVSSFFHKMMCFDINNVFSKDVCCHVGSDGKIDPPLDVAVFLFRFYSELFNMSVLTIDLY